MSPVCEKCNDTGYLDFAGHGIDECECVADRYRGPYITTFTGRFYPQDPRPEDVSIEDIAHHLSMICRYTGAGVRRLSVAEHSVHIYRWLAKSHATPDQQLSGLLHDAPEGVSGFGDVARPAKQLAPIIGLTEDRIFRLAIAPKFGIPAAIPSMVHEADNRIIADEMGENLHEVAPGYDDPLGIKIEFWKPKRAKSEFLKAFYEINEIRRH